LKTITDQGAVNLIEAIVDRTVKDFMVTSPGSESRKIIEQDILSEHFEALTGLKGSELLKHLQAEYYKKHQKSRKGKQA